jgi:hypothetical protein
MAGTAGMREGLGGRCRRDRRHPRILHPPAQLPQPPDGGPVGLQQLGRVVLELREQEVEVLQRRRGRHREAGRDPSGRVGHRLLGLLDLLWRDRCPASDPRRDRPPPRGAKPPLWPEVVRLSYPRGQQPEQEFGPGRMPSGKGRPRAVDAGERGLGRPARHNASAATVQPAGLQRCRDTPVWGNDEIARAWASGIMRFSLPYADRKLAIGSGAIAAARTMGARCSQSGSWRRSGRR